MVLCLNVCGEEEVMITLNNPGDNVRHCVSTALKFFMF